MKSIYLTIILFLSITAAQGQLEISLNDRSGYVSEDQLRISFTVTNRFPVDTSFYWTLETTPEAPTTWDIAYVYDAVICYPAGINNSYCDPQLRNYLVPNLAISYYQIGVNLEDDFVDGCITFHLISDCLEMPHDTITSYTFKFDNQWPTDVKEVDLLPEIQLYPNPVHDFISLTNDGMISGIAIYDDQSRLIMESNHSYQATHDVSQLPAGQYTIILKGPNGRTLSYKRFIKVE